MSHGDFYFAVNATFYHFSDLGGDAALIAYWKALGREYLRPLAERFRVGGLAEIETYYQDYFVAEPGGDVTVKQTDAATVILDVRECPAIAWLRNSKASETHPPVHPMYCQHCRITNNAMLEESPFEFEIEGGDGSCRQYFRLRAVQTDIPQETVV